MSVVEPPLESVRLDRNMFSKIQRRKKFYQEYVGTLLLGLAIASWLLIQIINECVAKSECFGMFVGSLLGFLWLHIYAFSLANRVYSKWARFCGVFVLFVMSLACAFISVSLFT